MLLSSKSLRPTRRQSGLVGILAVIIVAALGFFITAATFVPHTLTGYAAWILTLVSAFALGFYKAHKVLAVLVALLASALITLEFTSTISWWVSLLSFGIAPYVVFAGNAIILGCLSLIVHWVGNFLGRDE